MKLCRGRIGQRLQLLLLCIFLLLLFIFLLLNPSKNSSFWKEDLSLIDKGQIEYVDSHGMHVIVGRYVGKTNTASPNLTWAELNANNYQKKDGEGENGEPVFLSKAEEHLSSRLWHINKFNILVSDRISIDRTLPDVRSKDCTSLRYLKELPSASVIIVFHNEAMSTLLRTIHSVIQRTPKSLLKEIILVDDASTKVFLKEPLEEHMTSLKSKSYILRSSVRIGLIQARILGAKKASGQVLVFLDAHCETTKGWIQPLLERIQSQRTAVVCPVIDIISDETFAYVKSFSLHWGAFNWNLHFRWLTMSRSVMNTYLENEVQSYKSPTMAGGLFAIDKSYFFEIGSYDEEMSIWGGENLEMSFRVWMCGGSIEIAPCSHVGHVFRKESPYDFPDGVGTTLNSNLARVALVWMDDLSHFYFKLNPEAYYASQGEDVSSRLELRKKLNCHDFNWYLNTVWPQHFFPSKDRFFGKIIVKKIAQCLMRPLQHSEPSFLSPLLQPCLSQFFSKQLFVVTKDSFIMTDESLCLESYDDNSVTFQSCNELERQKWKYFENNRSLLHLKSSKCLSHHKEETSETLQLENCDLSSETQQMILEPLLIDL